MNKVGNSQDCRETCGGGRQRPVPGRRPVSRVNRHLQMRLTPGHPESTHCQERFRNPPASHEVGAQDPRWTPPVQTRKIHQTPHQPKRPRMPDSAQRADTVPTGPPRDHATTHPPAAPRRVPSRTTNCLRPPAVPDTASRHPGRLCDFRRPLAPHECTLHAGTGRVHTVICPHVHAGPRLLKQDILYMAAVRAQLQQ